MYHVVQDCIKNLYIASVKYISVSARVFIDVEFKSVTAVSGTVAERSNAPSSLSITYYMQSSRYFFW